MVEIGGQRECALRYSPPPPCPAQKVHVQGRAVGSAVRISDGGDRRPTQLCTWVRSCSRFAFTLETVQPDWMLNCFSVLIFNLFCMMYCSSMVPKEIEILMQKLSNEGGKFNASTFDCTMGKELGLHHRCLKIQQDNKRLSSGKFFSHNRTN